MANVIRGEYAIELYDVHIPYQSNPAVNIALSVIEDLKPKRIIFGGDIIDCPQISSHLKNPIEMNRFKHDRQSLDTFVERVKKAAGPQCKEWDWLMGNHEERWIRYLLTQAHAICDLEELDPANIFHLNHHELRHHAYMKAIDVYGTKAVHGKIARNISGATSRANLTKYGCTGSSGHAHRREMVMHRSHDDTHEWHGSGCLCDLDPTYTNDPNWNHGFIIKYMMKHYRRAHILPVAIIDGQAVVNGRGYEFEDAA